MAIIKLWEPFAVNYARTQVRDSLMYHGEEALLLSMFRPQDNAKRCPRCYTDALQQAKMRCPECYGTSWQGGIKDARRAWCVFSDHLISEQYGQYGQLEPDQRQVQTEAFPLLIEHDFIVRVRRWDASHTVLEVGGIYEIEAVTRNSLRTGNRYGQTSEDTIGQQATVNWLPPGLKGIELYPFVGTTFPAAAIAGTPVPVVVAEPDTKVVFYPVSNQSGVVTGAQSTWEAAFTFTQSAPASVWTISHTLGHLPQVSIIVDDEEVDADVDYPNINTVVITFAAPQTGSVEMV